MQAIGLRVIFFLLVLCASFHFTRSRRCGIAQVAVERPAACCIGEDRTGRTLAGSGRGIMMHDEYSVHKAAAGY